MCIDDADRLFRALAAEERRLALVVLTEHHTLSLPDLAETVIEHRRARPVADLSAEDVKECYLDLYHRHVPLLEDAGLIEYEQERDLVRITGRGDDTADGLEHWEEAFDRER